MFLSQLHTKISSQLAASQKDTSLCNWHCVYLCGCRGKIYIYNRIRLRSYIFIFFLCFFNTLNVYFIISFFISDETHESSYEETHRRRKSPDRVTKSASSTVNRELLYGDSYSTSRSKQTSPLPGTQSRDVKIIREATSKYRVEKKCINK